MRRGRRVVDASLFATLERGLALQEADALAGAAEAVLVAGRRQGARQRQLGASLLSAMLHGAIPQGGEVGGSEGSEAALVAARRAGRRLYSAGPEAQFPGFGQAVEQLHLSEGSEAALEWPGRMVNCNIGSLFCAEYACQ